MARGVVMEGFFIAMFGVVFAFPLAHWLFGLTSAFELPGGLSISNLELSVRGGMGIYVFAEPASAFRRREPGIRAALGGQGWQLGGLILINTVKLVGMGVAMGLLLIWLGSESVRALLFQVEPMDLTTLVAVAAIYILLALAVSLRPVIAAMRVDLARMLREE